MLTFFAHPLTLIELATLLIALFTISDSKYGYWRLFIAYIALRLAVETAGFYFSMQGNSTAGWFIFLRLISIGFFLFLFVKFAVSRRSRAFLYVLSGVYLLFFISLLFTVNMQDLNDYSRLGEAILLIIFSMHFYTGLPRANAGKSAVSFAPFWIATGIMLSSLVDFFLVLYSDSLLDLKLKGGIFFSSVLFGAALFFLYGCWSIAFFLKRKERY